jgi:hypothetical protein
LGILDRKVCYKCGEEDPPETEEIVRGSFTGCLLCGTPSVSTIRTLVDLINEYEEGRSDY